MVGAPCKGFLVSLYEFCTEVRGKRVRDFEFCVRSFARPQMVWAVAFGRRGSGVWFQRADSGDSMQVWAGARATYACGCMVVSLWWWS